jgi:hypothetical protein
LTSVWQPRKKPPSDLQVPAACLITESGYIVHWSVSHVDAWSSFNNSPSEDKFRRDVLQKFPLMLEADAVPLLEADALWVPPPTDTAARAAIAISADAITHLRGPNAKTPDISAIVPPVTNYVKSACLA